MTELAYLSDTNKFTEHGVAKTIGSDEKGLYVILDQTVFYPQGGGQPADKGYLKNGADSIPIIFVGFADGDVRHYIPESSRGAVEIGQRYELEVDGVLRIKNAKLHTAGHLISHVLEALQPTLIPIKGYHFPDGSYVEFLNPAGVEGARVIESGNSKIDADINNDLPISASLSNFETISKIRPNLAPFTPKDKPSRIVSIGDYVPLPCGGTHLSSLGVLGSVKILKTKSQKGNLKVSYQVAS